MEIFGDPIGNLGVVWYNTQQLDASAWLNKRKGGRMSDKKKVYVETTVVSDATALPTNDLSLAGRQIVTREWWNKAPSTLICSYLLLFVARP